MFGAQRRYGHEAVAAQPLDRGEEAEILDSGDPRLHHFADMGRQEGRDKLVALKE